MISSANALAARALASETVRLLLARARRNKVKYRANIIIRNFKQCIGMLKRKKINKLSVVAWVNLAVAQKQYQVKCFIGDIHMSVKLISAGRK